MREDYLHQISSEIEGYQKTREAYKKQFWLRSKELSHEQRKLIKKLFMKIDRLRNHLKLWLKHLVSRRPSSYDNYLQLIDRGRDEIKSSFKQLDQALYRT